MVVKQKTDVLHFKTFLSCQIKTKYVTVYFVGYTLL